MTNEDDKEWPKDKRRRGDGHRPKENSYHGGAKTFRRGRALAFLEMMQLKRSTIKQQLKEPEFQSIQPILVGELKAIDMIINEFIQLFEIHESEVTETLVLHNQQPLHKDEKGMDD